MFGREHDAAVESDYAAKAQPMRGASGATTMVTASSLSDQVLEGLSQVDEILAGAENLLGMTRHGLFGPRPEEVTHAGEAGARDGRPVSFQAAAAQKIGDLRARALRIRDVAQELHART